MNRSQSIYKAGRSIGSDNVNRTVTLRIKADDALIGCCPRGWAKNKHIREIIGLGLDRFNSSAAKVYRTAQGMIRSYLSGSFKTRAQVLEESLNELRAEKPDTQMSNYIDRMMAEECAEFGVK